MAKPKRGKSKKYRNLSHRDRFDEDRMDDRDIRDREQLRDRHGRWRERVNEDEPEFKYIPEEWSQFPIGTVLNMRSGHHYIQMDETKQTVDAGVRGLLKHGIRNTTTVVAPGDRVHVETLDEGNALIVAIVPRVTSLSRPDPQRPHLEDVIAANINQIIIVSSVGGPAFWPELIDRYLLFAEYYQLEPLIVVNKIELAEGNELEEIKQLYETDLKYRVIFTSAEEEIGIDTLKAEMKDRSNVIVGLSGVGKSSLVNCVQTDLSLRVQSVNVAYGGEGKHTTRSTTLHPLAFGGFVADTPGIRAFGLWDLTPEEVDYYFREFRPYIQTCQFNDCTHHHEPGCAIINAVKEGKINENRYKSFTLLFDETDPAHERPF